MRDAQRVGDLPSGSYFRLPATTSWFRVRRQVESYTEVQRVLPGPAGDLEPRRLLDEAEMVVPMSRAEDSDA